jgi:hypothetical protein
MPVNHQARPRVRVPPFLIARGFGAIRMGIAQSAILGHVRVREADFAARIRFQ